MRQVLVDMARAKAAEKRSAGHEVALAELPDWGPRPDQSVLALEDALQRVEQLDPLKGRLIEMRFFGGMTAEESSEALAIPVHVVRRELRLARALLRKELAGTDEETATTLSARRH
jgi:DNA-directed RNA polymerase specialized sigma24 family protein